jgi:hypothetical protein
VHLRVGLRKSEFWAPPERLVVWNSPFGITFRHQSNAEFMHFTRFIPPYCVTDWAIFTNGCGVLILSSELIS